MRILKIFPVFLLLLSSVSCKKETITEVVTVTEFADTKNSWKPKREIDRYSKFINNAYVAGDRMYLSYPKGVLIYENPTTITAVISTAEYDQRRPLSANYSTTFAFDHTFFIQPINRTNGHDGIWPSAYPEYYSFSFQERFAAFNASESQLIVNAFIGDSINLDDESFFLFDFQGTPSQVNVDAIKVVTISDPNVPLSPIFVLSFFDKFFAGLNDALAVINADGSYDLPIVRGSDSETVVDVFQLGNDLYAVTRSEIYLSTDQGVSWIKKYTQYLDIDGYIDFHVVDDQVVVSSSEGKLFHFEFNDSQFRLTPILADGLENNVITNVVLLNDTVYATSKSGTFSKPLSGLLDRE